jgi:AraC-like DNA-binding protein
MSPTEIIIRTIGTTAAVILAIVMARGKGARSLGRAYGVLFCLGVAAYLPCSSTSVWCSTPLGSPLVLLATGVPFFFWGWTRATMDDDFRLTPLSLIAAAALLCSPVLSIALVGTRFAGWGITVHSLLGIAFVAASLIEVLRTWRHDLIEARRRVRLILLVVIGGYSATILAVELVLQTQPATQALQLLNATLLTAMLLGAAMGLLSVSDALSTALGWLTEPRQLEPRPPECRPAEPRESLPAMVQPAAVTARDIEQELVDRLHTYMTGKAAYRDPALSIAKLAKALGVQEKRLRDVINRRLGHKNFPSYVNAFRLEEVKLRLADARNDHLPILTLALDAGFGSIVAFNRAFKDKCSITPTEYRAKCHDS